MVKTLGSTVLSRGVGRATLLLNGFPGGASGKEPTRKCRRHRRPGLDPLVGKIPWRRAWQQTPVFLPGEFHEQKSLVGYTVHRVSESDTTEQLSMRMHVLPPKEPPVVATALGMCTRILCRFINIHALALPS